MVKFRDEFFDELLVSAGVTKLTVDAAERVAAEARATAPVDTGGYRDGITVRVKHQKRVVALVVGTARHTLLVEAKTGNLVRALRRTARGRR